MTQTSSHEIEVLVARLLDALQRHDASACAAPFTDDALILSPYGPPAKGTAEIRSAHQGWFDEGETNKRLDLLDSCTGGELGYCVLAYSGEYLQPDGSYAPHRGRSVNVLRRGANGGWLIQISSMNVDVS